MRALARRARMRREAVARLMDRTGWDEHTAWQFLETLPYSTIPEQDDAIAVLDWLDQRTWSRRG